MPEGETPGIDAQGDSTAESNQPTQKPAGEAGAVPNTQPNAGQPAASNGSAQAAPAAGNTGNAEAANSISGAQASALAGPAGGADATNIKQEAGQGGTDQSMPNTSNNAAPGGQNAGGDDAAAQQQRQALMRGVQNSADGQAPVCRWQNDAYLPQRRRMIIHIVKLLQKRKPGLCHI